MRATLSVALFAFGAAASLPASTWTIDPAHSAAQFAVRHMMVSTVRGEFGGVKGTVEYDPGNPAQSKVDVTIDTSTLTTREPKRDAHLKSADFFDVEKYPTMTFRSKKVEVTGPGKLKLTGDLTLRGATREVVLDVDGPSAPIAMRGQQRVGAAATTEVNRTDYGMVWNRTLDAGGVVVGDEVTVTIDVELTSPAITAAPTAASR